MRPDFKTLCIVGLAGFCALLTIQNASNRKLVSGFAENFERGQHSEEIYKFRVANEVIKKMEANQVTEATYLLYMTANPEAESLRGSDIPTGLADELKDFGIRYQRFLQEQCAVDNYDACLLYGNLLAKHDDFDAAYDALLKSANSGNYSAMAALVDLYRNKKWSKHSEQSAKEWLNKVGK